MQYKQEMKMLEKLIPADHRYRVVMARVQNDLGALPKETVRMARLVVLQVFERLNDDKLLHLLAESFCARWLCGYALSEAIPDQAEFERYKQSISALTLTRTIKCALGPELNGQRFLEAMELCLNGATNKTPNMPSDGQPFFVLVTQEGEAVIEAVEADATLELICARSSGPVQNLAVYGHRERIAALGEQLPSVLIGAAQGVEWYDVLDHAFFAFQRKRISAGIGVSFYMEAEDGGLHLINLSLANKRLAFENFLKQAMLENAYSLFEDIVDVLCHKKNSLHWFQVRHELLKLYLALYNGALHYGESDRFFTKYFEGLNALQYLSLDQAVTLLRNTLHNLQHSNFQDIIDVGFSDYANQTKEIIDQNYSTDLSLGDIARRFDITPEYLSTVFRKEIGSNFVEYLTDVRIEHACRLLSDKDLKVNEIARMVGFENADYFGRVFKRKIHMTPRQYQKNKV